MTALAELTASRELLANLTLRELRGKYKGSALGWGWSLVNPVATMLVFTVVFHFVLRVKPPAGANGVTSYPLFLLCGLLPWTFLSNSITGGMSALIGNANLIKKTYFPRELLVAATVGSFGVSFLIEMAVLCTVFVLFGSVPFLWLPAALLMMLLLAAFTTGLTLAMSVLNVYFRDTQHFATIFLQLWFYATPVIYPITQLTDSHSALVGRYHLVSIYRLNPMTDFVEGIRDALYTHRLGQVGWLGYAAVGAVATFAGGYRMFNGFERRLAEEL